MNATQGEGCSERADLQEIFFMHFVVDVNIKWSSSSVSVGFYALWSRVIELHEWAGRQVFLIMWPVRALNFENIKVKIPNYYLCQYIISHPCSMVSVILHEFELKVLPIPQNTVLHSGSLAFLSKCTHYSLLTSFNLSLLESSRKILAAPVLLRVVLHHTAVRLHLLIEAAAVNQHGLAALRVPAALSKHLLQLLDGVTALPLPNAMLFYATVASP